ncbi:uncharacterized protein BKCO1_27000119 [Diplodia corticola]|uniref:Uncharacterized protein n=1 Tax=Diplodia corticola TaxID=236234 RepID=A0A1J9R0K8_9PEZI|nr:uncharacterized protein BKCO1_27000119 [Diplodia corticola]OJD33786.1 hypothetical protein BKCO1_27000119 [Diplodia corticola]
MSRPSTRPPCGVYGPGRQFEGQALPFRLPNGSVLSSFPTPGQGAPANALAHVVLSDPHLPWARPLSREEGPGGGDGARDAVPWLAVLVFTREELSVPAEELREMFSETSLRDGVVEQAETTLAVTMKAADVVKLRSTVSSLAACQDDEDETTDVVFVPSTLFAELVTAYDNDGDVVPQARPDASRYKYLAHVREVQADGMAEAGAEDEGSFGIVLSHRTGPLAGTQPEAVVAHLVSIEGVEDMDWPLDHSKSPRVAMASLHSWSFTTLPAGSPHMDATLRKLGQTAGMLRVPDPTISPGDYCPTADPKCLRQRLHDGYTLTRYRTPTGETTAALLRGPLTPVAVPYPLPPSPSANTLPTLDPDLGIPDITYSAARQVGRTLALASPSFTTALTRLLTSTTSAAPVASSPDWKAVHRWLQDLALLRNVPTTHLVADTASLPPESLRFFHVDRNWVAALVDGALSLGPSGSSVRRAAIRSQFDAEVDPMCGGGFLLRSAAVMERCTPGVRVVGVEQVAEGAAVAPSVLRQDVIDSDRGVVLCLLGSGGVLEPCGIRSIELAVPPGRQTFSAAAGLDADAFRTVYKRQGGGKAPWNECEWGRDAGPRRDGEVRHAAAVFKWGGGQREGEVRTLLFPAWVEDVRMVMEHYAKDVEQGEDFAGAAMVGVQLSDSVFQLVVAQRPTST